MSKTSNSNEDQILTPSSNRSSKKRFLSSPDYLTQLKKNKPFDLDQTSPEPQERMADTNISMDTPSTDSEALPQGSLNPADVKLITDALRESFRQEMRGMVKEIAGVLVSDITSGVIEGLKNDVSHLKSENEALKARVAELESKADVAEQYSRRNCLRISGYKEVESESTDEIVLDMAKVLDVGLSLNDLDRTHRVGKKQPNKPRDIIIKFTSYRSRKIFYKARVNAKDKPKLARVYINEDLTRHRNHLLYECRSLVKSKRANNAWSSDGTVLLKDRAGTIHRINKVEELSVFK